MGHILGLLVRAAVLMPDRDERAVLVEAALAYLELAQYLDGQCIDEPSPRVVWGLPLEMRG